MKDTTCIVTGASSGIGIELVRSLIDAGAKVACCARNISKIETFASDKNIGSDRLYVKSFDVQSEKDINIFVEETHRQLGPINYLFNNVGMNTAKGNIFEINTEDFDNMYAVNMRAPMIFTREVSRLMIKEKIGGHIINLQSTCCLFSNAGIGSYTATKCGFNELSKIFRKELRDYNIKVLNVYPGGVDTAFRELDRPDYLRPESVAKAIISQLILPKELYIDDLVLRPHVEINF